MYDPLAEQAEEDARKAEAIAIISLAFGAVTLINSINQPRSVNGAQGVPGGQGIQGIQGPPGTTGAAGPGTPFTTIFGTGVITNAADNYLSLPFETVPAATSGVSQRVFAPNGSTWRARLSFAGTIGGGEVLSGTIRSSATFNGAYADTIAVATINNGSGANANVISGTLTMGADTWLTCVLRYTTVVALVGQSFMSLERLT